MRHLRQLGPPLYLDYKPPPQTAWPDPAYSDQNQLPVPGNHEHAIIEVSKDQLNLGNFSKGAYFINFIQEEKRQNIKIIKQ